MYSLTIDSIHHIRRLLDCHISIVMCESLQPGKNLVVVGQAWVVPSQGFLVLLDLTHHSHRRSVFVCASIGVIDPVLFSLSDHIPVHLILN